MTASELTFLAIGLVFGVLGGAALIEVIRGRPPVPRVVRITVQPGAIPPRRASTLSDDSFFATGPEPAPGGPADRRFDDLPLPTMTVDRRTNVRSSPGVGVFGPTRAPADPRPGTVGDPALRLTEPGRPVGPTGAWVGIPVSGGDDPILASLRVSAVSSAMLMTDTMTNPDRTIDARPAATPIGVVTAIAVLDRPVARADDPATAAPPAGASGSGGASAPVADLDLTDACAGERRIAAERCGLAVRARAGATTAADTVRAAQRAYDDHMTSAEAAGALADPRAVRREKENAQARFRETYNTAQSADDSEVAARAWLTEINDINAAARAAAAAAKREKAAATAIGSNLERLALESDAARIAAETAEAACLAARQALAECDERSAAGVVQPPAQTPWTERPAPGGDEDEEALAIALSAGGTPTVFRLVRGDRQALIALVDKLGGEDPVARRKWQLALSNLVDAIVAVSIEAGALEFPADHPFWGAFTLVQDREIAQALASLGHRFDGLGGFTDERVPSQRDLSLALGYAGLDPMRIRQWPTETEMAALFEDVTVAADEHLAGTAGDLSLSELVALLGRRADGLADLWNDWGRVRPLLLEGA